MSIQFNFFVMPAYGDVETQDTLNRFLRSNRVLNVHREFINDGPGSFWSLAVEYLDSSAEDAQAGTRNSKTGRKRIDYREVLSPDDFALYVKLRDWRKQTAGELAVPVYTIFTNEQMAQIVRQRITAKEKLKEIEGIGDARIKKYGDAALKIVKAGMGKTKNENNRQSVSKNSGT